MITFIYFKQSQSQFYYAKNPQCRCSAYSWLLFCLESSGKQILTKPQTVFGRHNFHSAVDKSVWNLPAHVDAQLCLF